MIDVVADIAVCTPFIGVRIADYRQQIVTFVFGVLVKNQLHLLRPFDNQLLSGFATTICDVSIFKVCLSQLSLVNEAHSTEIETHHKHITSKVQCRT